MANHPGRPKAEVEHVRLRANDLILPAITATGVATGVATGTSTATADASFDAVIIKPLPSITLKAVFLETGDKTDDGQFVLAVREPWYEIVKMLLRDPDSAYQIPPRKFEELIAGAWERTGYYDEVILTPRSGDKGRDVIATKRGYGSVRIFDEVKAKSPDNLVPASVVRGMLGVLDRDRNVSKGIITTTSNFAPGVWDEFKLYMPHRLELKPLPGLLEWLGPLVARDR